MTHHAQHMIALKYLETPKHRVYRTAYRMHLGGLDNMRNDAQTSGWHHWKIHKECVETGAIVERDDDSGKGYNFSISKTLKAGAYILEVRHCCAGTGAFGLKFETETNK